MEHNPVFTDSGNPEPIQNMEYRAINGGFEVSYDLPADKDILYVKAEYIDANGALTETRSSAYDSQVTIEGFGDTEEKTVTLYVVDRSANVSEPVSFNADPLEPPYPIITKPMEITKHSNNSRFSWTHELNSSISILLL